MEKIKSLIPFFLLTIVSILVIYFFFPTAHPYGGVSLSWNTDSAVAHSRTLLEDLKIDFSDLQSDVKLISERSVVRQMQERFGLQEANRLLRDSVSAYFWEVQWRTKKPMILWGEGKHEREESANSMKGDIILRFDEANSLVAFQRKIGDSVHLPSISASEAKSLTYTFLQRYTLLTPLIGDTSNIVSEKHTQQPNRNDHEYVWTARMPILGNKLDVKVGNSGNLITKFEVNPNVPAEFTNFDENKAIKFLQPIVYILLGIFIVVIAFKRFRSYEIGFRLALLVGLLTGVAYDLEVYLSMPEASIWDMVLPLLITPLFVGGFLVVLWAVSESLVRETWKDKFASFDLLSKGYVVHSRIGQNIIRGISLGTASFAFWLLMVKVITSYMSLWISPMESWGNHTFDTAIPAFYILSHSLFANMYIFTGLLLFAMSFLHRYISSRALLIGTGTLILTILSVGGVGPLLPALLLEIGVNVILIWTFYQYDAIASLIGFVVFTAVQEVGGLFMAGNPTFIMSAWIVVTFFSVLFIAAIVSLLRKKEITDFDSITPAFAKHITERQRLQQELEIARNVQMSFLPKCDPSIPQFDICSRCAPALEVGGDYYDFIEMGGKKFAVAVGDVSGKGTQAAFFMTLTKGFLRALAHVSDSPAEVLTQVNHLFYENVDRGMFISMIYGVFDLKKRKLTIARAGHNPVIMRKSKTAAVQVVNPAGLALGLDSGIKFEESIEEVTVDYHAGDLFIFYTDGFTEAMNKEKEEYGEDRLTKTVEKLAHLTAAEIITGIFEEMKSFVGKHPQHDDMTIVVVKVKSAK